MARFIASVAACGLGWFLCKMATCRTSVFSGVRKHCVGSLQGSQLPLLRAATRSRNQGKAVSGLRQWSLDEQNRSNHNKATCALANKIARICYATLRDGERYQDGTAQRLEKKISREFYDARLTQHNHGLSTARRTVA